MIDLIGESKAAKALSFLTQRAILENTVSSLNIQFGKPASHCLRLPMWFTEVRVSHHIRHLKIDCGIQAHKVRQSDLAHPRKSQKPPGVQRLTPCMAELKKAFPHLKSLTVRIELRIWPLLPRFRSQDVLPYYQPTSPIHCRTTSPLQLMLEMLESMKQDGPGGQKLLELVLCDLHGEPLQELPAISSGGAGSRDELVSLIDGVWDQMK